MTILILCKKRMVYNGALMEDNFVFEWLIHTMEIGVVIGIGVVVWYIKSKNKSRNDANPLQHNDGANAQPDRH